MAEFVQRIFDWPVLPATILLCLVTAYWLLVILGAFDIDLPHGDHHFDIHLGGDGHESLLDWGLASLKWLNLSDVPLMIWLSAFTLPAWLAAVTFNPKTPDLTTWDIVKACARDAGIGLVAAKLLTQPLKGKLKFVEPNPARQLIGRTIIITTTTATPEFGQGQLSTGEGAPLLLNVRTFEGAIEKGREARIVEYDPASHVYYVETMS